LFSRESIEIPRGVAHRGGDIELGKYARNSGELGLEVFFIIQLIFHYLFLFLSLGALEFMTNHVAHVFE